jgi:hypothetical protein
LILASVGLVQAATSTQTMSTEMAKRNLMGFMKNIFDFSAFLICVPLSNAGFWICQKYRVFLTCTQF